MASGRGNAFRSLMTLEELLARDDLPRDVRSALERLPSDAAGATQEPAAERALRASEERYRRITEAITDYTYTVRVEGGRASATHHSPACEAVTGYSSEEYAADPSLWYRMVSPEDRPLVEDQARRVLTGEDAPPIEHRLVRKDGSLRWVRNSVVPHRDRDGRLLAYDGVVTDVTERRSAEERVEMLKHSIDVHPDGAYWMDTENRFVYVNSVGCQTLGYRLDEMLQMTVFEVNPESSPDAMRQTWELLRREGNFRGESVHRRRDGSEFPVEISTSYVRFGDREYACGFARDISARKRAEQALRESEEKFSKAFLAAPVSMSILALSDGTFLDVNDEGLRVSGFTRQEVLGRRAGETGWIAGRDRRRLIEVLHREGRVRGIDMPFRTKSGREILGLVRAEKIVVDGRECLLAAMVDVTERRRAEEERLALERRVWHAQKLESLGVLAGGIAHDFNNLLVAILGNASLANCGLAQGSPLAGALGDIEAAARRASELCSQLLAYSGRGTFVVAPVDLNQPIEEMVHLIQVSISKKVDLHLDLARRALVIEADATQLRQVVLNLVVNASEAIGEATGTIVISTGTSEAHAPARGARVADERPLGPCAYLEVRDDGSGMDAETQGRLFDPFFTTKFTGRGLGLSAVLGIVKAHHGAIEVESAPRKGTLFRVLFPLLSGVSTPRGEHATSGEGHWRGEGTVLVIDDDASVRAVAQPMVERYGFSVLLAEDGLDGVEVFRAHADGIALVLLDLTMPRLGGREVLQAIRALRKDVPIVLMSGYGESEAAGLVAGQDVQAFLQKPFDMRRLAEALQAGVAHAATRR